MCVLCMFYVDLEWEGRTKLLVRIFLIRTCYGRVTGNKQLFLGLTSNRTDSIQLE